jgi:hypothetical protein
MGCVRGCDDEVKWQQQSDAPWTLIVCVLASGIDENLLTVATAPVCQTTSGAGSPVPDRPRVFVVKPQLTLASLISPLAKVPQLVVKGEKFNPAIRKSRIGGWEPVYGFAVIFSIGSACQSKVLSCTPHDYVATMTAGPVPLEEA